MIFITNLSLLASNALIINAYGEGPLRMVESSNYWQIVAVDNGGIIATLFQIDKTALIGENTTPLVKIMDART